MKRSNYKDIWMILVYGLLQILLVVGIILTNMNKDTNLLVFVSVMNTIMFTISIFLMLKVIKSLSDRNNEIEKLKEYDLKLQQSIVIFKKIEVQNDRVRKFYHDFINHAGVIRSLHEMGSYEEEKEYREKIRKEYLENMDPSQ